MSDHSKVDEVASGAPYRVVSVNGQPPGDLDAILTDGVSVIVAARGEQEVTIHGDAGRVDQHTVLIHEKAMAGTGKDVRTWAVTARGDGLQAVERSMY